MSRTKNTLRNIQVAYVGQIITVLINFISRKIFIEILGAQYLGVNGLFTNIMSLLSLAELGIGSAIIYSMYKPIASDDRDHINSLLGFYRKAYYIIGSLVLILGLILTPFLNFLTSETSNIPNIEILFLFYVFSTSSSYFFSYKRSFLIANQKKYIDSIFHYSFYVVKVILQVGSLLIFANFYIYLAINLMITVLENIVINKKINEMYPYIKTNKKFTLHDQDKKTITKNVGALVLHKVASIVVMGTDNILISKFVGLAATGIYSNYILITSAVNQFINIIFQSLTAIIGNLAVTETKDRQLFIFECIDYIGFWLYGFASISLYILINPFIALWLGNEYILNNGIVLLIVLSFYLTGRRWSVLTYKDALGLFWYDRYKPIFESLINLIVSVILGLQVGLAGIIIGTIVSTITTCFWIEPYVLFKYGFERSVKNYFKKYIINTLYLMVVGYLTYNVTIIINLNSHMNFVASLLICLIVPNVLLFIPFFKSRYFEYAKKLLINQIIKRK